MEVFAFIGQKREKTKYSNIYYNREVIKRKISKYLMFCVLCIMDDEEKHVDRIKNEQV